jgi:hypothetical protein
VILAVLTVAATALPASLVRRILPPDVGAEDFSGTLWHGSAGRITVGARDAGALEWRLKPAALLELTLSADVHWVKIGYLADATASLDRARLRFSNLVGGGPAEDLRDLGVPPGWRGATSFKFTELTLRFTAGGDAALESVVGDFRVSNLAAAAIAQGADLGGFVLHLTSSARGAKNADVNAEVNADVADTGGPLEVEAKIHFSGKDGTGALSGTIKARPEAAPALRAELATLTQLHAPDARGRIPVELEFTL